MKNHNLSRRKFIRQSAAAAAAVSVFSIIPRNVLGRGFIPPSDKVNMGFIGTGKLIHELMPRFAELPDVMILAGCDVDKKKIQWFKDAVEKFYTEKTGKQDYVDVTKYEFYEELLERQDIDAVMVATPDHWHALAAIAAIKAGKDVYCEKPLTHRVREGRTMVNAARQYDRVVQTGSMQRSWKDFRRACEIVRNGYLGEIKEVWVSVGDPPIDCNLGEEPVPGHLNWDRWLGPAQFRPYHSILAPPIEDENWPDWRRYNEFGGGGMTDWGAHMFDIAQWGLGMDETGPVKIIPPKKAKKLRGIKYIYANGITVIHKDFRRGWAVRFKGTEGTIDISREFLVSKPKNIAKIELKDTDKTLYFSDNHYNNWIQCIKKRTRPVADVEIGHRTASVCNIGNICYRLRRPLDWDPEKEEFLNDEEANKLLTKDYRPPYIL